MHVISNCFRCLSPSPPQTTALTQQIVSNKKQKTTTQIEVRPKSTQTMPTPLTTASRGSTLLSNPISPSLTQISPSPSQTHLKPTPTTSRLLIADDVRSCRKCAHRIALSLGFSENRITLCSNLEEAKSAFFEAASAGDPFQYVFSDRDMGNETDGDIFAKNIRDKDFLETQFILISGTLPEEKPFGVDIAMPKGRSLSDDLSEYFHTEETPTSRDITHISTISHDSASQGF